MLFYAFRFPSQQTCLMTLLSGSVAFAGYSAWDVVRSRREAVPLFDSAAVVRTEESARYPCKALRGFDVVVRSFYIPTAAAHGHEHTGACADCQANSVASATSLSPSAWFRRFADLFSNETHRVDSPTTPEGCNDSQSCVRQVVCNATASTTTVQQNEQPHPTLLAAARWPPHTSKFAALVLEPSAATAEDATSSSPPAVPRTLLRQLADRATHQSLVRCNARSTLLDMACEGDPSYLGAPYLRVLLSAFLLLPSTLSQLNVAVLGVGGGSLPLFLQHYFASRLHSCDLVDVEPMCFKAAVEQLGFKETLSTVALRNEGGGVRYYVEDAVQYLRHRVGGGSSESDGGGSLHSASLAAATQHARQCEKSKHGSTAVFDAAHSSVSTATSKRRQQQLDILFVDLFVGSELDSTVASVEFLQLCRSALSPYGVAAFNLPATDKLFAQRCVAVFGSGNVLRIPVPASSNEVVVVRSGAGSDSGAAGPALSHRHLYRRAQELTAQYRLPYDLANHYPVWWRL